MINQVIQSLLESIVFKQENNTFDITPFPEKNEYNACTININNKVVLYREAKITPTKTGLFVAIWTRNEQKTTRPYYNDDIFDYLLVAIQTDTTKGYFIFSKPALIELNLITTAIKEGKRGTRLYPSLDPKMNKQALSTYTKQIKYFNTL